MRFFTKAMKTALTAIFSIAVLSLPVSAAEMEALPLILFKNVNIFNGTDDKLYENHHVLIEGNLIKKISTETIDAAGATVIDGSGRTLMPGLIENHAHLMLMGPSLPAMESGTTWEDFAIHGSAMASMYLMHGFTTLRDAGGTTVAYRAR